MCVGCVEGWWDNGWMLFVGGVVGVKSELEP